MVLALIVAVSGFIGMLTVQQSRLAKKKRQDIEFGIQLQSGIETMLLSYRLAEMKYIGALTSFQCDTANPFLQALKEGSRCQKNNVDVAGFTVTLFKNDPNPSLANVLTYVCPGDCKVDHSASSFSTYQEVVQVGMTEATAAQKISGTSYQFYLNTIFPEKGIGEFIVNAHVDGSTNELKRSFAIRPILPNSAHMDADNKVKQENPDPLGRCQGGAWEPFLFFDPETQQCRLFAELGSGTGLVYYQSRYFGFRPFDGQIIDMYAASGSAASSSYMVGEDGKVGMTQLFPPYKKANLVNVDDITTIDNQVYYVALSGSSAHIGGLNPTTQERETVCALGSLGWAQAYTGIAALTWSDELMPIADTQAAEPGRLAVFFLKTDPGNLLTAVVSKEKGPNKPLQCNVFKDRNIQKIEYARTYGFDRTTDSKPYFIY